MSRKKIKLPLLEKVHITDAGAEGKAIAKTSGKVVFVSGAVPGDVADLQVIRKRKSYLEAKAIKIHQYSEQRTEPVCEHFGICGGCKWQNLNYEAQLFYKQKQVADNLIRLGGIELPEVSPIIPAKEIWQYRNKLEYTFSNKRWLTQDEIKSEDSFNRNALGFHVPGRFDKVVDIKCCHLQQEPSNAIRNAIREYAIENNLAFFDIRGQKGFLRNLIIRTSSTGETMTIISFYREAKKKREGLLDFIAEKFPEITSLMYVINPKKNDTIWDLEVVTYKGKGYIHEKLEDMKFKLGPISFFQTNTEQALKLYKAALDFAKLSGKETVYDLYTGIGTIANFIAGKAKKVIGLESIPEAVENAKLNSKLNHISNTQFYTGDIRDTLNDEFIATNGKPDIIITDPPRVGMHKDVVDKILKIMPQRIVYVSCNPATQARDLGLLHTKYKVEKVQPVDMFPHTHHVENVVLMSRK